MDGAEMSEALRKIGWSVGELSRRLGVRGDTVRNWLADRRPIPRNVAEWLLRLAEKVEADRLPENWE
jgi:lambda repressor-like predicted transcriptional regulator